MSQSCSTGDLTKSQQRHIDRLIARARHELDGAGHLTAYVEWDEDPLVRAHVDKHFKDQGLRVGRIT